MKRSFDTYAGISVAQIVLYTFFLAGAILLSIKHGFLKSSGWRYLIVLALARLIGGSMYLATLSDPTNTSLYIGWLTLNGLGLGPLVLMLMGLLSRVFESINRQGHVFVRPPVLKAVQLLMIAAVVLIIVGGTRSTFGFPNGKLVVHYNILSEIGTGLMIAVIAILGFVIGVAFLNQGYVSQGEHRIIFVTAASYPFILVRLAYSCILIFGQTRGSAYLNLGMSFIPEIIVVIMCQILGFSLDKVPAPNQNDRDEESQSGLKLDQRRSDY